MKIRIGCFYNYFLFFLPFTHALTISLFFPLKISELLLVLLLLLIIQLKVDRSFLKSIRHTHFLIFFLAIATFSFIVNAFWEYDYALKRIPFRIGGYSDSALRLCYIYLNVAAFFLSILFIGKRTESLNFWLKGALIAAFYSWYLFISSALGIPYIKLIGMDEDPQNIMGIVRAGTFKEGNFFSLYLLLSASISFYLKRMKVGWFLLISIITTISTIGILSGLIFLIIFLRHSIFKIGNLKYFIVSLPILFVAIFFVTKTETFDQYIYRKLFTPVSTLTPANLSKVDRYLTSSIAVDIGIENPILGVGPYNYGLHYDRYNNIENIVSNHTDWSLNYFKRVNKRAIPNNVYLEIWAEYGVLGFVLLMSFLIFTLVLSIKQRNLVITAGLLSMYLSFNAFPSFIMLFIWVYLAIPYAIAYKNRIHA